MTWKVSREDQDRALFKYVGALLDSSTPEKPERGRLQWLAGQSARRLKRRLHVLVRRHPLVPASVGLCLIVWICIANVTPSTPEKVEAATVRAGSPLRVAPLNPPPEPAWERETDTTTDLDRLRPLSYWLERLQDPDWIVRSETALELVKQSRSTEGVLSALVLLLSDPHAGVRFWVADRFRVLGIHGEAVRLTMRRFAGNDELLDLYVESDTRTRQWFLAILRTWLTDLDDEMRWTGLTVCGVLGAHAGTLEPTLEAIARSDIHDSYRKQARLLLRNLPTRRRF